MKLLVLLSFAFCLGFAFSTRHYLGLFLFSLRMDHEDQWIRLGRLTELGWTPLHFDVVVALAYRTAIGKERFTERATRQARYGTLSILAMIFSGGVFPCVIYLVDLTTKG